MELAFMPTAHSNLLSILSIISLSLQKSLPSIPYVASLGTRSTVDVYMQRQTRVFYFGVYLLCILSTCPWLSLFHAHRQKSYSLQKPIRQAGHQIIEVVISPRERQLIVMLSEAAPNKIRTLCLLQPFPGMDRIWNNMDMSGVHLEQPGGA